MVSGFFRFLLFCVSVCCAAGCADGLLQPGTTPASRASTPAGPPQSPAAPAAEYRGPETRPFLMGFSQWPADLTDEGIAIAREYADSHGDLVSVMFIGGIPWQEALDDKPFSKNVQDNLSYRPPAGKKLLLSISPLNKDKRDIALYWGDRENQPLPKPWDKEPLNSPRVKKAFLNFVLRAVDAMHPDYLAIGVESNVLLSRDQAKWQQLKELHRDTYSAVKKIHSTLPVFFSTDVLHYKRLARDAKASDQEKEVADLMRYSDFFAMSLYPYMSPDVPRILPQNFLDFAKRFKKAIAVTESGMSSRNVELKSYGTVLYGSDADQTRFTEFLLKTAARDNYEFVVNFASTDSDRLVSRLRPPMADLARIWAYIGMQTSDRRAKPASAVWNGFFGAKYQPANWW